MAFLRLSHEKNVKTNTFKRISGKVYVSWENFNDRFDRLEQQQAQVSEGLKKVLENTEITKENTEILKKKADAILRQQFELAEYTVPRLFIVLPDDTPRYNPAQWFHLNYRLYFLCECENDEGPHFAFHEGYKIKRPREFLRKYGPYLCKMLTVVRCMISAASVIAPQLKDVASGILNSVTCKDPIFWNNLSIRIQRLDEILIEAGKDSNIPIEENIQYVEGANLRGIESFLNKTDEYRTYGNLFRSSTDDGHVRWLCIRHCESHYSESEMNVLCKKFQDLGGAIEGGVAIIPGSVSKMFSKLHNVLRQGLPIHSIVLKDLSMKEKDFDLLLEFVSRLSVIHNLEIENINVLHFGSMKNRDIISKLNDTLKDNSKLNIQFSFTKPLPKFAPKLIDVITETNSNLVFRIQSQEDKPSLELAGTKKAGFILAINDSDSKNVGIYEKAVESILKLVPNITKIVLRKKVMSQNVWTMFYRFLTYSKSLKELTFNCHLTLEQTKELSNSLKNNGTLKILHMFNAWERENESEGPEKIFDMLQINKGLIEFTLTCHTDELPFDFVAKSLLQNKSLRVVRLPKCEINQTTDIPLMENFLRTTCIQELSLELISENCGASLEKLARAVDKNETLEIFELKGSNCSATFHRKRQIPDVEIDVVPPIPIKPIIRRRQNKFKRILSLFSCHKRRHHRHLQQEIIPPSPSVVPTQIEDRKDVTKEPFYALCNHPSLYKQIQESTQNLKLEELQVVIGARIEMTNLFSSIKSNLTVTHLKMNRSVLAKNDIKMLTEALRDNKTITHLNLNEIDISMNDFRQIFKVLRNDRMLRVLEVSQYLCDSQRDLFKQEIEVLELANPFLKVIVN